MEVETKWEYLSSSKLAGEDQVVCQITCSVLWSLSHIAKVEV